MSNYAFCYRDIVLLMELVLRKTVKLHYLTTIELQKKVESYIHTCGVLAVSIPASCT